MSIRTFHIPTTATGSDLPTFVLLHGVGLSHRFYGRLGRLLAGSGHVVSFDLPGFGSSPRPSQQLSVTDHAALIRQELARLGTGPVILIGHSMGAQFAIEVARQNPALVSRVILIGPVVDDAHRTLRAQALGLLRDAPLEPLPTQIPVVYDYLRCGVPWFLSQAAAMRDYPTHERIRDLIQPILIVRGEHDPIAGDAWCRRLSELVVDGRLVTIVGKRHNVPHSDPATTAAAITTFAATQ